MDAKQIIVFLCLFGLLFSAASAAHASDLSVQEPLKMPVDDESILEVSPGSFDDLNSEVNDPSAPDDITLERNYVYEDGNISDGITINRNLSIDGKGNVIDANHQASVFNIVGNAHVILNNIIFINANSTNGGAINVDSGATVEIIHCTFINNTATHYGGAIYIAEDDPSEFASTITDSTFEGNSAFNGGAVYVSGSSLYVSHSDFTKNVAQSFGGSIFVDGILHLTQSTFNGDCAGAGGSVYLNGTFGIYSTVEKSTFENGHATNVYNCVDAGDGGALFVNANNVHVKDLVFRNNVADDDGGAICWKGSNGIMYNITCENNRGISATKPGGVDTSSTRGGTICLTGSDVTITKSSFTLSAAYMDESKDYSKVDGGALFITGNNVIVNDTTFVSCNATNGGGAVYVIGNSTHIYNCDFNNCIARDGAALYIDGLDCTLYNSTFTNNVAYDDGGAIYWNGDDGYIYNITCIDNKGISGYDPLEGKYSSTRGGTICLTGSGVTITKSSFALSSAYMDDDKDYSKVDGGALFITGNDVIVNDTTFESCDATNNGGAIYVIGNGTQILNCDFTDCLGRDGGAIYVDGNDCKLYNSTISQSISNDDGGAIYWEGDNGYIYNITCIDNRGISGNDPLDGKNSNSKGGTICLTGSNVTIDKSSFTKSSAESDGGTLFITGNDVKVLHSDFTKSISFNSSGGAVYIIGNRTTVFDCTFDECEVNVSGNHRGGAIFVAGNDANITKSSFTNTKALVGGAICIDGNDTIVDNSIFWNNDARSNTGGTGGAININGANAIITNSDFSQGTAVNYGGAIAVWGPNAQLINNTFDNSKTTKFNGGAIFVNGTDTLIALSNFTKCNALGDQYARGGAIDVEGDDTRIIGCNFDDCDSHYGGVIYVSGANAYIVTSTFIDSEAYQGGAIYVNGTSTSISNSNFTDITADNYGGSIYVAGANANISQSNFIRSTVKNYNGGAIYIAGENTNIEKSNFTSAKAVNTKNKALGGAIYIEGANAVIKESAFDECQASEGGGAIYAYGNAARIEDSTFNSDTAKYGGAIYLTSWGSSITRSNVTGSIATQNGGGVYVAEGSIHISESNFDDCIARGNGITNGGGAIYINGPDTHISASNFSGNTAPSGSARGGAIFINGERTIIEGSEFDHSTANQGGVIFIEGKDAVIDTSTFSNSLSKSSGGSIYVKGDEATIKKSIFENISAKNNGGAIYVDGENTDILNSSFYNCTAKGYKGGAIYIEDKGTTVAYSNFTLSKAKEGGAIYIEGENTAISYCNLDKNVANSAGAIKVFGDNTIISNSNFTYNNATSSTGGALDIGGANASVYYSWFDHNDAKSEGGAINWLGGHGDDSIIGSTFTNNVAHGTSRGGGAIYWTQGLPIASGGLIKDCIFINNTAAGKHGGAIDWFQAIDSVIDNCLFINNTAYSDGGALYTGDQQGNSVNLTITNSQFYNNTARKYGGAVANQMANSYIYNNIFDGNKAWVGGGTILMKEGPADNSVVDHCYIFNSYVSNVTSNYGEGGGAILIGSDSNITISNSAILNSTIARGPGGAIAIGGSGCSLINVSIQDVSTQNDDGGAIYWKGTNGKMDNVTIVNASTHSTGNLRSSNGGAIHISGWYCDVNDVKIFQSSANNDANCGKTNYGGAIYVSGSYDVLTNIVIDDSNSTNVKMNAGGGAIFYDGFGGTLINATISNTLATGNGGAIYWKGSSPVAIENISITYSQTEVIDSANSADGGAIYSTTISKLSNVYIDGARAYKNTGNVNGGAIYLKDASTLDNVTVVGSRASTDSGTSRGGAVYLARNNGPTSPTSVYVYNSSFEENNADLGGGLYFEKLTACIYGTLFEGNVANEDGGAIYSQNNDEYIYTSTFEHNSAKRGGAIFSQDGHIQISDSTLEFNTAEEKGGAIYYNYGSRSGSSVLLRVNLLNNTAFQGSAIYGTKFSKFSLTDVVLLDNQANSNKFTEKAVGVDEEGNNYTSAVFLGFDNLLNAIWQESNVALPCTNVTYWGVNGRTKANSPPTQSDREVNINVTVEIYDENGAQLHTEDLVTDKDGRVKYTFDAEEGKTYYFAYVHKSDRYYTYLRDTLSNSSLVKIYVYSPIYYGQNQTILISLTDGAWGNLNGTVTVTFNDTNHTTFTFDVRNGTANRTDISNLPIGYYNATATFEGDINHTGDTDWTLFEVLPYNDLEITKEVNVTADVVNVSDVIRYIITVTNHGPSKAYDVNVTEILSPYLKLIRSKSTAGSYNLTGGYWYIGDLDVGDSETLIITAEIIHEGPITNTVWVTGLGKDINMSNNVASAHNFTAVPLIDLRINKVINDTRDVINVLDKVKFTITVVNDGPCDATGVIVEELLDDHLKLISSTASAGRYRGGTWNIGKLSSGSKATLTIVAQVVYSGNISNAVHVSGYENESNYKNNYAAIKNITAVANVDLQIDKYVNVSDVVNVTDQIKFVITVTNNGPCNATGVYVAETLNPHLKVISNKTTVGKWDGSTWVIGNLNNGETHYLTIIAEVISAGNISNIVAIYGNDNDTNKSNNNDSIKNITAVDIVDLEIHKTADVASNTVHVGDTITFNIVVKNNGPCDATNVNVTEVLSPHLKLVRYDTWDSYYDVGEGVWYIGNLTSGDWRELVIVAEVVSAGNISNAVIVTGSENDTNKSNNKDEIPNITATDIVDLQIKKDVNFTGEVINVTDYLKYTITVFNDGPSNATNVNVSEVLSPHLKLIKYETEYGYYNLTGGYWYIGRLNNQSTAVLTIYAQVISNGTIANMVVANCTENDTDWSNNRAEIANITAVYVVDLQIKKEVNTSSTNIDITEILKFTITVHNAGPCNATGVYVCEPLSDILIPISINPTQGYYDGYRWIIDNMTSGSTVSLTIVAKCAYTGIIENEVNVTGREIDSNFSNNKDNITPIYVSAHIDLGVNKTVARDVVNVSDLVEFTIVAYNKGPCNASGVYVLEALNFTYLSDEYTYVLSEGTTYDGYTWYIGQLDAGAKATLKISASVIKDGNFTNYVEIFGYGNDTEKFNNNATVNVTAKPVVDLNITKEVNVESGVVYLDDTIFFTVTVVNNGPSDATNVNVTEVLDTHLRMVNYTTWSSYYDVDDGVWYIGNLTSGDWRQLVIEAKVIAVGNISNAVRVVSTENDTNESNNNASVPNITAEPIVDLKITKDVNFTGDVINVTDYIKFTITVFNDGPSDATNVNVTEVLSSHLKLIKYETEYGYYDLAGGYWYIGDLANQSTAVLTIYAQVISEGTISNVVVVNSTEKDSDPSNNKDEIDDITAVIVFDLQIKKDVNTSRDIDVTDLIKYTITVHNAGPCNATDVYVGEPLSDNLIMDHWDSEGVGWYDGYTWYIGDLNNGSTVTLTIYARIAYGGIIENKVNVTGSGIDTNLSNNKDNVTLNASAHVDLQVFKIYTGKNQVNVNDEVIFHIIAYNNGPCNATGVYVLEALDGHLGDYRYEASEGTSYDGYTWDIGRLNSKESVRLTIFARVIAPGNFSNYVEIHGYDNDTDPSNNNASIPNITANPVVDLAITKEVNVTTGVVYYNDTIKFTINVTNNGPCDATYVNVTEELDSHLELVIWEGDGYYDVDEGVWYIGDVAKDDTAYLEIVARVIGLGNITNVVSVISFENDTNKSNNNDSIPNITAEPIVDLRIQKTVNVNTIDVNVTDIIEFTITVWNDGPSNATNVYVREPLSDCLEIIKVEGPGRYIDRYTWVIGDMVNGTNATLKITAKIIYSGIIENMVYVTSNDTDSNMTNNYDNITPLNATTKADLAINKTVNVTTGVVNVSDLIEFTIVAHNYGPCNATGVYVLEALDSHLALYSYNATEGTTYDGYTWYIGKFDAGANATLKIVARVIAPGNFSNYVEIFGYDNDTNQSNNNATIPNITANPLVDLAITKEVDVGDEVLVGQRVVFTLTVKNNGPCDATNVNVTEVLSSHLEMIEYVTWDSYYDVDEGVWYIGNLTNGDWRQIIIVTEVVSVGNISNAVVVTSTENDTNESNNNDTIPNITAKPAVDLQITKDVNVSSRFVNVTDFIEYTIIVYNDGPCNATNVNVTEVLNPYLEYAGSETDAGYYNVTGGYWYIGDLEVGAKVNLTIQAQVIKNGTVISNVVVVNSSENDTNPYNNRDEVIIAALPVVDLRITKEANVTSEIGVTDYIEFTITVYNDGPCNATGAYVIESLSDKLRLISNVTSQGVWDGYTWNIDNVTVGANVTLTIVAQVIYEGNISNDVVVYAYQNETNYTNNNASIENITALTNVDLIITKDVNVSGSVNVSDIIEFTITVTNIGPCNATGVYVSEVLSPHLKAISNKTSVGEWDGATWVIGNLTKDDVQTLTIVAEVVSAGNISNVVAITSNDNDTNESNNNASIPNITAENIVDLNITKTVDVTTGFVAVGDTIVFTVTVWNNGPCAATNVNVTEVLSPHLNMTRYSTWDSYYDVDEGVWYIGDLAKDDWRQLVIVAEVISAGNISNVVVVTSSENDTNESNNNASIPNITAVDVVDLEITKEVNVGDEVLMGQSIIFTITVRNIGHFDATNVNVTEVLNPNLKMIGYSTWDSYYDVDEGMWYIGNLARGDWRQLVIVAEVISVGNISNVVVVTSSENDTNESNNNASIPNITAKPAVDLYITKTVNVKSGVVNVTDIIEFDIVVYNAGPCDATNVNVSEVLSPHLKLINNITENGYYDVDAGVWYIGNLANQSRAYLSIIAQVISNGTISNVVVVTSTENDTDNSTNKDEIDNITAVSIVDLRINKTVNVTDVNVSDCIEYTINIINEGPCNATDVVVWDKLSDLLEFVSFDASRRGVEYDDATGKITVGNLNVNENVVLTIVAKVIGNGTIENIANITSNENDTNKSNNNGSSENVTSHSLVDLAINKTVNVTEVNVNDYISYTIKVVNNGPSNATDIHVNDNLSELLEFISFTASRDDITYDNVTGIATVGNLAVGETVSLTIVAKVIGNGTIENVANVTSHENDTNKSNNNGSSENVTSHSLVDLAINKTVSTTVAEIGDEIVYVITVHNYGPSDATDVSVDEKLSDYVSLVDKVPSRGSYDETAGVWHIGNLENGTTVTLSLTVKVIAAKTIENIVSVRSDENDTNMTNNNYTCDNVTVGKSNTPIILIPQNITYGDDETILVILPTNATGTVNITINGTPYNDVPLNNGIAELIVPDLAGGDYDVTVVYGGDESYVGNSTTGSFNVAPAVPIIKIEVVDIWHGEIEVLNVTVNAPGTVNITVYGITIEVPLNHSVTYTDVLKSSGREPYDGKATWNLINLPVGRYPAFAIYNANENYTSVNTSDVFYVRDKPSTVVVTAEDIYIGEDAFVDVKVGPKGVTGNVTLVVDGRLYNLNISEDGKANVTVPGLSLGLKHVYVKYNGDILYRPSENNTTFNVLKYTPPINIDSPDITVGEDGIITVTVPSDATGNITIVIDGKNYTQPVENGTAVFIIPGLEVGEHEIVAYYSGDDKYLPVNTTGSIKVNPLNNDTDVDGDVHVNGISLSLYSTGNPILILLFILFAFGYTKSRRFK